MKKFLNLIPLMKISSIFVVVVVCLFVHFGTFCIFPIVLLFLIFPSTARLSQLPRRQAGGQLLLYPAAESWGRPKQLQNRQAQNCF